MAKKTDQREPVSCVFNGRTFEATYTVSPGMVHVTAIQGRRSAQLGGPTAQSIAEQLFREIIEDADARGTLA